MRTACTAGDHDRCEKRRGIGMTRDGAFAPWVRVPSRNCVPVPDGLRDELAALARRAGARQVVVRGFDDAVRFDALRRMGFDALVDVAAAPPADAARAH